MKTELYEQEFEEIDKLWASNYGDGEQYCHFQSFSWGFQEGADWVYKKIMKDIESKNNNIVSEQQMKEFVEKYTKNMCQGCQGCISEYVEH